MLWGVLVSLPEHHHYPVGSSHLDVRSGNGVLLPLLCRLLHVPLPVSMQEKTHPGQEGKTLHHCGRIGEDDEGGVMHGGQIQINKASLWRLQSSGVRLSKQKKNTNVPEITPYSLNSALIGEFNSFQLIFNNKTCILKSL